MALQIGSAGVKSDINITPLVDVVLVLLIIFMVVTPLAQVGYDVQVPPARTTPATAPVRDQLIVRLDAERRIFLNREEVPRAELPRRLAQAVGEATSGVVFFAADGSLPYGEVAAVLDLCRASGARDLGVVFDDLAALPGPLSSAADG